MKNYHESNEAQSQGQKNSFSIRLKILLSMLFSTLLIAGTAVSISFSLFRQTLIRENTSLADATAEAVASIIDADKINAYLEQGNALPEYQEIEKNLYWLRSSNPEIEYIYVYRIQEDGCHTVFDLDTDDVEGAQSGEIIPFDESFNDYLPALLAGHEIEPIITDDTFGWLLTVYQPVYDSAGVCQCYACVDISMNELREYYNSFAFRITVLIGIIFIITVLVSLFVIEHQLILPINKMAYAASAFAYDNDKAMEENVRRIKELNIHTGDEIENLYRAIAKTTQDSMNYVADIEAKTQTLSQMQNGLIIVLADMVESRDQNTGDHIRKTAAYVALITEEMKKRGYYQEQMTDEFIANVVNAAPLHDVGKIHISDTILNKPGRLTDEEFRMMQSHTTFGSQIIERVIEMVPDPGYLETAKDLAEYHHEKWNGKGYPHGISGEDIPLSARIMAVADVFDALVSRRSYKEPFSFEKAMQIIRKDAGTHFDPLVAEAFLGAEARVRQIAEEFQQKK